MFRKLASIPKEYESIGGGFYRKAHEVWRLEASDDENRPFKLIRVKSEKKFEPEAGLQKQAGMRKTASAKRRARVFRAGNLVEVTVRTDDGDKAEVEHDDGIIEILPSTMVHDAEPSIENMQMIPEDGEANIDVSQTTPGHGRVDLSAGSDPQRDKEWAQALKQPSQREVKQMEWERAVGKRPSRKSASEDSGKKI